jgi:nucleotide-binding universal stress UspA family protein
MRPCLIVGASLDPRDGTEALVAGLELERLWDADVVFVHAVSRDRLAGSLAGDWIPQGRPREILEQAKHDLHDRLRSLSPQRIAQPRVEVRSGSPHRVLTELARNLRAQMIIVGAADRTSAPWLGSTADRVLRKASCPVLVVRGRLTLPPTQLLVPVDLSTLSSESVEACAAWLHRFPDSPPASVELLHVSPELTAQTARTQPGRTQAERELGRFLGAFPKEPRFTTKVRTGPVVPEILGEIEESHAQLVVLGTHGRGGFERYMLGSVAADIARTAPTSVLMVPPRQACQSGLPAFEEIESETDLTREFFG